MRTQRTKIPVAILGATGMVGRRFAELLAEHPWFEVVAVAASSESARKTYLQAMEERGAGNAVPASLCGLKLLPVDDGKKDIAARARIVFSAFNADAAETRRIEEEYAALGLAVVSNNSAHRNTVDVPVIIPEVNEGHLALIEMQRKKRGWKDGCIVAKPNCSLQSYVPAVHALRDLEIKRVAVTTMQAVSGAGRTLEDWPEMHDNVIPFIGGEEEKSEKEPLKILGDLRGDHIEPARDPLISATCIRVPVSNGHMASIFMELGKDIPEEEIVSRWEAYAKGTLDLPSAPHPAIRYFREENRPQTRLDRDEGRGMAVSVGRLRKDGVLGWKFVALSHNTIRGAAGGAVLIGELLVDKGYVHSA